MTKEGSTVSVTRKWVVKHDRRRSYMFVGLYQSLRTRDRDRLDFTSIRVTGDQCTRYDGRHQCIINTIVCSIPKHS